jgi:hypothetical protein
MVSVAKSLYSGAEQINHRRSPSENESKLALPQSILHVDKQMHLPLKGTRRTWIYCSSKEVQVTANIECFTYRLSFCLKR